MSETHTAPSLPRLLEPAPEFSATSTNGPIKLSDYKGKWVVLFSHPADFTPVCTTEFVEFARRSGEFKERGAQLVGLSVVSAPATSGGLKNSGDPWGSKKASPVAQTPNT